MRSARGKQVQVPILDNGPTHVLVKIAPSGEEGGDLDPSIINVDTLQERRDRQIKLSHPGNYSTSSLFRS